MRRRAGAILGAITIMAAVLTLGPAPAGAAGSLTPWSSSVAVGGTFSVTASGCPRLEEEDDEGFAYQEAQLVLITGTGAGERLASFGVGLSDTRYRFQVPGWVDPAQPAVVAGRCIRTSYVFDEEVETTTSTTLFAYGDAAIDITPGTATPSGPIITVDRDVAAGGQVITVSGSGCEGSEFAQAVLYEGTDLSGRTADVFASGGGGEVEADGTFEIPIALNDRRGSSSGGGPLDEGGYTVLSGCTTGNEESGYAFASPLAITISGTNPSGSFVVEAVDGAINAMGSGCLGGQQVTVNLQGYSYSGFEGLRSRDESLARRSVFDSARVVVDENGEFDETYDVTPDAAGNWSLSTSAPEGGWDLMASADCGEPTTTGFRYIDRYLYEDNSADLYIERASPTSSPAGGTIQLTIGGFCETDVAVAVLDGDGDELSRSETFALNEFEFGTGTTTAPATAGTYYVAGICGDEQSYPQRYEVFTPKTVSAEAPLAEEPTEGWPSRGARETYHGKIGPIALPAMEMGEMAGTKALGPSELFIPVPRPEGDFAITKLTFDLVDAEGMPVSKDAAHLHHFVITNTSQKNPACPGSTFGLSGQIVGAAGAERTVLQTGDPYGLVVKDSDDWSGVYELMSRSMEDQTVFLSYDIDYRRDVDNVRPVTTYFGSASGCSSFTWTIDGSGTPDTQTQFITVAKPGRLIGAGGHVHNGAKYADWTNDRGRRLCRSEVTYGDEPVGHTHMLRTPRTFAADDSTATTAVGIPTDEEGWPPEFYDDDLAIESISNCPLAESLSAGERLQFDAVYENDRARSGVMGIFTAYVWEGGGPAAPGPGSAEPVPGTPTYTG